MAESAAEAASSCGGTNAVFELILANGTILPLINHFGTFGVGKVWLNLSRELLFLL